MNKIFYIYAIISILLFSSCNKQKNQNSKSNKDIVKEYIDEVIVNKNYNIIYDLVDEDFTNELSPQYRVPSDGSVIQQGLELHLKHIKALHADRKISIKYLDFVEEDNKVAISMIVSHNYNDGRVSTFPWIGIFELQNGKIIKAKHVHDTLLEYIQLNDAN
ncbi:nuclear transport factor 2 family protein [Bacteroidota bacterium]